MPLTTALQASITCSPSRRSPTCRDDQDDTLADFSNWGPAVDVAAPGVCILSTFPLEQGEYGTISGTSMASPHAAGALALLASRNNPNDAAGVYALYDQVRGSGNFNWTDDSGDGIQEPLLDVSNSATFNPIMITAGGGGSSITLEATVATVKNGYQVTLAWSGANSADVDIWRDSSKIATTPNDGDYSDKVRKSGSYIYKVCEAGTTTCSAPLTVDVQ